MRPKTAQEDELELTVAMAVKAATRNWMAGQLAHRAPQVVN